MAQFAINNSRHSATGFTPFYLNHGEHPRALHVSHLPDMRVIRTTDEWVRHTVQVVNEAKKNLRAAQDRMVAYANQRRRDVAYQPGDKVLLSTTNMTPTQGVKKLMPKYVGPFVVQEMVGKAAVRLSLTDGYERLHDVFHVSLVKPWIARAEELAEPVAPLMYIKACPELPLITIVGHRYKRLSHSYQRKVTHWRARWQGKNAVFETWEEAKAIPHDNPHIVQYQADHLGADYVL
jgi:translation initiation factor IF-1